MKKPASERSNRNTSATEARTDRAGISLVELLVAFFLIALVVLPIMRALPQSFGIAGRQADQEIALKIGESAVNTLLAVPFDTIAGSAGSRTIPFEIRTGTEVIAANLALNGPLGTGTVRIGRTEFQLRIALRPEYSGPPQSPTAMVFSYIDPLGPVERIATYACPDLFMRIQVDVEYGQKGVPVSLATFRADLRQ
ncbi:MAG TPA: prepilin-type N-terminal cleavage/methylation domain-containing protein [Candidatus Ozemobacteraceae bacterium]|nr:prepilin-type N-terminal cleavage/methylation domain-containing protein [Candidatus Ozemobacteraceae bacterium]